MSAGGWGQWVMGSDCLVVLSDTQTCSPWLLAKARSFLFVAGGSEGRDWLAARHLLLSEKALSTLATSPRGPSESSSPHTARFTLGHRLFVHSVKTHRLERTQPPQHLVVGVEELRLQ